VRSQACRLRYPQHRTRSTDRLSTAEAGQLGGAVAPASTIARRRWRAADAGTADYSHAGSHAGAGIDSQVGGPAWRLLAFLVVMAIILVTMAVIVVVMIAPFVGF
jgi:hypothetical protein